MRGRESKNKPLDYCVEADVSPINVMFDVTALATRLIATDSLTRSLHYTVFAHQTLPEKATLTYGLHAAGRHFVSSGVESSHDTHAACPPSSSSGA